MTSRIAERRAAALCGHPCNPVKVNRDEYAALLDCAEALRALLSYTKACEELLNAMPAGQVRMAEEALAKLNGDDHE